MSPDTLKHLPYTIDENSNRFHYYETLWKHRALELLTRHEPDVSGWTLLDYGCGRGETLRLASDLQMQAEGLDVDPKCVEIARGHGKAELLELDPSGPQLVPKSYDVITCFHVLEHVDNPKQVLSALARAAKRYVIVAVPNLQKIPNFRKPGAGPSDVNEGHLQSWDHSHFKNLAERHCGLRLIGWAHDATVVPIASELIKRVLGEKAVIRAETGMFRRLFPYWGHSIIGLFTPVDS
jgi:2-polyprenyl-3-methyl-5-hydroxy-6-metoxy-1,4-benzoquinol methylase